MRGALAPALVALLVVPAWSSAQTSGTDATPSVFAGGSQRTTRGRARRDRGGLVVTQPEFHMLADGQSRFHCVVHGPVSPSQAPSRGRFEVLIRNARLGLSNDRRPLETRFFETPATRMALVRRGQDVVMVFELRAEVAAEVRTEPRQGGGNLVVVEFPAGQFMGEADRRVLHDQAIEPTVVVPVAASTQGTVSLATVGTTVRPAAAAAPAAGAGTQATAQDLDDGTRAPAGQQTQQQQTPQRPTPTTRTRYDPSLDALDDERPPILNNNNRRR